VVALSPSRFTALEARAHAILGRRADADTAITRAQATLAALTPDNTTASAFGYHEAQLRFHHGNALTHLHDSRRAWEAQRCPPSATFMICWPAPDDPPILDSPR
jgi:hypothetical protein